jgi:hypothetical protein
MANRKINKLVGQPGQELVRGLTDKLVRVTEGGGIIYAQTGAELATDLGHGSSPEHYWLADEASGATDLVGSVNLITNNTPTYQVNDADLETCIEFDGATTDAIAAQNTSVLNITTQSFAYGILVRAGNSSGVRGISGKWSARGYTLWSPNDTTIRWQLGDGTNTDLEIASTGDWENDLPMLILAIRDQNADNSQLFTSFGDSPGQVLNAVDITQTGTFQIGHHGVSGSPNAFDGRWGMAFLFDGVSSEGLDATNHSNLETALGIF